MEIKNELTSLPKRWCIKVTDKNIDILGKWRTDGKLTPGISNRYLLDEKLERKGYCVSCMQTGYTEITFDQFKRWVLKEEVETEVKYIECLKDGGCGEYIKGKVYKVKYQSSTVYYTMLDSKGNSTNGWGKEYFKPTTEEAYLSQNDGKSVEKNLVGRYLKALVAAPQGTNIKRGEYEKLVKKNYENHYTTEKGWTYTTDNATANQWEVMPIGFNPNSVKIEEKVDSIHEELKPSPEWLLEEANRRYPIGTEYKALSSDGIYRKNKGTARFSAKFIGNDCIEVGWGYVYVKGKWAEIVPSPSPVESVLDKWLRETKAMNLSESALKSRISCCDYSNVYLKLEGALSADKAKILFNKWNTVGSSGYKQESWEAVAKIHDYMRGVDSVSSKPTVTTETMLPLVMRKKSKKSKLITINKK